MSYRSAKNGTVWFTPSGGALTEIAVRDINVLDGIDAKVYSDSSTSGIKGRVVGPEDWTGSFNIYLDGGAWPGFSKGDQITLKITPVPGRSEQATAVILSIARTYDIENGEIISATIEVGGHLDAWTVL